MRIKRNFTLPYIRFKYIGLGYLHFYKGGIQVTYEVKFYFGNEKSISTLVESENVKELEESIIHTQGWYRYYDKKHEAYLAIQMSNVLHIVIKEYQDPEKTGVLKDSSYT